MFKPTHILFVGAAGALSTSLSPGQVVIADKVIEYDFDDRALARNPGKPPRAWDTDEVLGGELASAVARVLDAKNYRHGTVLTGDKVVCDVDERDRLRKAFGGDCIEMEGAAVAATSSHCGIPVGVLRVVSDFADKSSPVNFAEMLSRVGTILAQIVEQVVGRAVTEAVSPRGIVTAGTAATASPIQFRR
jgi:adenosylhomocysteine nucleosidase